MASGLSMPVGFKNGTDGSVQTAIDAMRSAFAPHSFLGIDPEGMTSIITTSGNQDSHLVLRGGRDGTNYGPEHTASAAEKLRTAGLPVSLMVDCSHANSGKDPLRQPEGRFDRAMKAVFARISRHRGHIKPQIGLCHSAARGRIPAQPSGGGLGKATVFGRIIDGVAFHLVHATPPSVILSHLCDKALAGLQDPLI
jgi:hypothetical protein